MFPRITPTKMTYRMNMLKSIAYEHSQTGSGCLRRWRSSVREVDFERTDSPNLSDPNGKRNVYSPATASGVVIARDRGRFSCGHAVFENEAVSVAGMRAHEIGRCVGVGR